VAARTTSVRELDVLKWCSDHMNVISHSPSSKKNLRPVLAWMIKKGSLYSERTRISDKCRKITANLTKILEIKQLSLEVQNITQTKRKTRKFYICAEPYCFFMRTTLDH
jgi:hypothetical protein